MKQIIIVYLLIAGCLALNAHFDTFGDEADNYLGGKLIAQGQTLYADYWSHHMPLMYHVSAFMAHAGSETYIQFRLAWATLVLLGIAGLHYYLRHTPISPVFPYTALLLVVCQPMMHAQQLRAEVLAGYLTIGALLILWYKVIPQQPLSALFILLFVSAVLPLAGLAHLYLGTVLALMLVWSYRRQPKWLLMACIPPTALVALLTLPAPEAFIEQAYRFNAIYYAPFQGGSDSPIHALMLFPLNFGRALIGMLAGQVTSFSVLVVIALGLAFYWWGRGRLWETATLACAILFSFDFRATGYGLSYHNTGHHMLLVWVAGYAGWLVWQQKHRARRYLYSGGLAVALMPVFVHTLAIYLALPFDPAWRADRQPEYVTELQGVGTVWLASGSFATWLALDSTNPAAPYYFYFPWHAKDKALTADLMQRLATEPPSAIVYDPVGKVGGVAAMPDYAPGLVAWIHRHYAQDEEGIWRLK